ncbi:hypothetical protein GUITHDRAFT_155274, partial [Guillardia theta CCMP2712]
MPTMLRAFVVALSVTTISYTPARADEVSFVGLCTPSLPAARILRKPFVTPTMTSDSKQYSKYQPMNMLDRRSFLSKTLLVAPALSFGFQATEFAAAEYDTKNLPVSLQKLMGDFPLEDATIAIFDDNSKLPQKMLKELQNKGIKAIGIGAGGDLASMRDKYRENECYAAIVPDGKFVKNIMSGRGLECD